MSASIRAPRIISNKTAGPSQSSDLRIGFQGKILMILQEGHLGSKTN
jgi:hypothetical protein